MITVVKKERTLNIQKKEINIQIGKRLQTARENNGYTQELFAEALDVGVESLQAYAHDPDISLLPLY
jgi:DNA-binding XRE family transcriptional regulator